MKRLAPLTGVLFFLVLLGSVLSNSNDLDASSSGAKVLAHYRAHQNSTAISGILTVHAIVVGLIFYGQLRDYLRRHEGSRGLAATAFGGAILFAVSGGISAGVDFAVTDSPSHLSLSSAQTLNLINMDVANGLEFAGVAILLVTFGAAILAGGLLPAWLGWIAFPLAVVAVVPPIAFIAFIGVGVWTLVVSIVMWQRSADSVLAAGGAVAAGSPT